MKICFDFKMCKLLGEVGKMLLGGLSAIVLMVRYEKVPILDEIL